jgi:pseudouridine synthase
LNRFLALSGLGARRKCEDLVWDGRVEVNGVTATSPAVLVDPARDRVTFDGERVRPPSKLHYLVLFKPSGVVVSADDERGRATVYDLLPGPVRGHVRAVGRLDRGSEGLLLFTNDGELSHALLHPSRGVARTYLVWVRPLPSPDALRRLRDGVPLGRGEVSGEAEVRWMGARGGAARVRVTIREGKNREIRRMMKAVGCQVLALRRIRFDGVTIEDLRPGAWRRLRVEEIESLRKAVGLASGT